MDIPKKIKHLLLEKGTTAKALSTKLGVSQPNVSYKLNNNAFNVKDLEKIAIALDCELEINFVLKDGTKI